MSIISIGREVFFKLLNISLFASALILAVILLRILLKKSPKWVNCLLWGIVAIRLICPFSIESSFSLFPSSKPVNTDIFNARPYIDTGVQPIDDAANSFISSRYLDGPGILLPQSTADPINLFVLIWIAGVAALLIYAVIAYCRLHGNIGESVPLFDNIKSSKNIQTPFILGIIKPIIYVPAGMEVAALEYVISHENTHISRRDHWWKLLGYLLLSVYWFNPFVWIAYALFCKDIELACDEKVIRNMDNSSRAEYLQTLLDFSASRKIIDACPLAFGEVGVKERIKAALNYRKPAFWVIAVSLVVCVVLAACFLTVPPNYGSLNTHAKEVGMGEPIDMSKELTISDCIKYSPADRILEHYSAVREHWFSKCEIDGTVINNREIEYLKKMDVPESEYPSNIETKYLKDEHNECAHSETYYLLNQIEAEVLGLNIDVSQYPKKQLQTMEKGYVKVVFENGPCSTRDEEYDSEKYSSYEEWIKTCVHYVENYTEIREYYLDPASGLILKIRSFEYSDGQLVRSGGSDQLYIR